MLEPGGIALATEIACVLRYKSHYFRAEGINASVAAEEFLEHAEQEQDHADWLAGGKPLGRGDLTMEFR